MIRTAIVRGLLFGAVGLHLAVVGVLLMLHQRWIIIDTISLGQAVLVLLAIGAGVMAAPTNAPEAPPARLLFGLIAGAAASLPLAALMVAMDLVRLQAVFIALSHDLFEMLSFDLGDFLGVLALIGGGAVGGLAGAVLQHTPPGIRRAVIAGAAAVVVAGVFQELIQLMLQFEGLIGDIRDFFYTWEGLSPQGAAVVFAITAIVSQVRSAASRRNQAALTDQQRQRQRMIRALLCLAGLAVLPALAGSYIGQVLMLVGLFILMGMCLNLDVGLAGLLDLGFVAFFAVGAYATALLTADNPHALLHLSYWAAMPIAVLLSICMGVIFGIPVLGVRGDYLAVATMGLGEIVRVIVLSDFASPLLGGAQGLLQIPKPALGGFTLGSPVSLFYLTLVASGVAAFVAWRLENSRLGRAWMALRDDEDVAQALGINLIRSKLMAYGLGAAFAGLAGSIFAVMLGSVYPSSFQLLISINVLALIIVGGMGSLPGVALGSIALIGLPELLREFGEYRYLFYGAVLIIMMRLRPEGLWPSEARRRELHGSDESLALDAGSDLLPAQRT
ncbi:MAG: branched-chain amino acid ABC transporter permease [Acetobacteraceae bacterium]|nr:branched-chain amino acid ABC transporter permease [Acetobacteraceae bacterium]